MLLSKYKYTAKGNDHKLWLRRFTSDPTKKNPRKMVQQWTEQPGGFVEHSDLKGLKTWLRKTTVHIIYSHFVGDTQKAVSRGPF